MKQKKILILVNHDVVIYNFRKELIESLLEENYKVYVSSPYGKKIDLLIDMGCEYLKTDIERHGKNIFSEIKLILEYRKIIKKVAPEVVLTYTIKPNIYGGLVCRFLNVPYISTITGLGTAVEKKGIMQKILIQLYKFAFADIKTLFFQNKHNQQFFYQNKIAKKAHKLVPGSGVNIKDFPYEDYPSGEDLKLLFIGRVMKEKGIEELVEAAKCIKARNQSVKFEAVGFYEPDYAKEAKKLEALNIVTFHGNQNNIQKFIKTSHAVILPSYHEGMANVLLEAASMGRPILASAIPGCEETFDEGISGLGFEPKSVSEIVKVIEEFFELTHEQRKAMGNNGRIKIEKEFNREIVVQSYLNEIKGITHRGEL
ncbi:glycosyltransferase family 4 protein [Alkalihalophilus sp. As8PL]|uniref:Glycosyltransferase family 4 protein n=1 Tax=Alkalihalophilus sp. As8PL TaxID=3237103 RepID=A0AB39BPG9_9BACI